MLRVTGREPARRHRVIPSPRPTTHAYLPRTTSSLHLVANLYRRSASSTNVWANKVLRTSSMTHHRLRVSAEATCSRSLHPMSPHAPVIVAYDDRMQP